jgi:hypothetical protein
MPEEVSLEQYDKAMEELNLEFNMMEDDSDVRCSTPDPNKYHNPASQRFETGGDSIANRLPGRRGLSGIVIPRSTPYGGSRGVEHEKPAVVTIDPHVDDGSSFSVDISKVNEQMVEEAYKTTDTNNLKLAALQTYKKLAHAIETNKYNKKTRQPREAPTVRSTVSTPVTSFEKSAQQTKPIIPPSAILEGTVNMSAPVQQVSLPTQKVTFEVEGFGTFETAYHKVVCSEDEVSLVLVYDNRFQAGMKYFPQPSERSIFVDVHSLPMVFKVQSAGIRFTVDNYEMCVLLIENAASKEATGGF